MALEASYYSILPKEDSNIVQLSYSRQGLTLLPEGLADRIKKEAITRLDLSRNRLSTVPAILNGLQVIDLAHNSFTELPLEVCKLTGLKGLILKCNNIKSLPQEITELQQLEELNLSGNSFEQFPRPLLSLSHLSFLHLGANAIHQIPSDINKLKE